ncbi:DHS-like NAD/FAD-binding domain-containing protein [Hygrophoropsis aurantiaca]|uniref:DHS-like NAD/FAD-binding domain-containing protein n=1 Tax=Hygrophoropsis aurantiaca TaxID=72124 RepID=A0ACB8A981_9AGAM|nr:DHS-like NAD/FAD-binding domain-containing protein [Hygrophoropsis aurantiaca]
MSSKSGYPQDKPVNILEGRDLKALAKYIKSESCKNVFLMVIRLLTTSAGIPDFRSPETGLYANLARLNLPYPEAVFQIDFFRRNPIPFYTLAKELYPGRYRPTITHSFIKLLHSHSLLHTCFTQNIDTLERRAGVPGNKIIEAHGSFATQRCIDCQKPYDDEKIKQAVMKSEIPRCEHCEGLVKPDIVFFGEALPRKFHLSIPSLRHADLLIVMGTSLTVHPFASLVTLVPQDCPRVLINLDDVGHFNRRSDIVYLRKCDEVVRELCQELGWEEELDKEWKATENTVEGGVETSDNRPAEEADDEVAKITRAVEESLSVSEPKSGGLDDASPQRSDEGNSDEITPQPGSPKESESAISSSSQDGKL